MSIIATSPYIGRSGGFKPTILVKMPYIGSCLSVNHAYTRNIYTGQKVLKREAKQWRDTLACMIRAKGVEFQPPVEVIVSCVYRDKRNGCDGDNLGKLIMDSCEDALGINDRDMRFRVGKVVYDKDAEPTITVSVG